MLPRSVFRNRRTVGWYVVYSTLDSSYRLFVTGTRRRCWNEYEYVLRVDYARYVAGLFVVFRFRLWWMRKTKMSGGSFSTGEGRTLICSRVFRLLFWERFFQNCPRLEPFCQGNICLYFADFACRFRKKLAKQLDPFHQSDLLSIFWLIFGTYYHQVLMVGRTKNRLLASYWQNAAQGVSICNNFLRVHQLTQIWALSDTSDDTSGKYKTYSYVASQI